MKNLLLGSALILMLSCQSSSSESQPVDQAVDNSEQISAENDTTAVSVESELTESKYADYKELSTTLPKTIEGLDSLMHFFNTHNVDFSASEKDSAYFDYLNLMYAVQDQHGEDDLDESELEAYKTKGFNVFSSEGISWIVVNEAAVGENFKSAISKDVYAYSQLGEYSSKQLSADAGLWYTFSQMGEMILELEDKIFENENSVYLNEFIGVYQDYLNLYMWGLDNTPIFDWSNDNKLDAEVEKSYQTIIEDANHKTGLILDTHLRNLKANDPDFFSWQNQWRPSKDEIKTYFGLSK